MKKLITLFLIIVLALPTYLAIGQGQNIVVFRGNGSSNTNALSELFLCDKNDEDLFKRGNTGIVYGK